MLIMLNVILKNQMLSHTFKILKFSIKNSKAGNIINWIEPNLTTGHKISDSGGKCMTILYTYVLKYYYLV